MSSGNPWLRPPVIYAALLLLHSQEPFTLYQFQMSHSPLSFSSARACLFAHVQNGKQTSPGQLQVDFGSARKISLGFSLEALEKSWGKKEQVTGSGSSEVASPPPSPSLLLPDIC